MLSLTAFADEREKAQQRTYDAMLRKAKAGHVTGGAVYGYRNVAIKDAAGRRSHVQRQVDTEQAAVIREIFTAYAAGAGVRTIAKRLNNAGRSSPRPQQGGRPDVLGDRISLEATQQDGRRCDRYSGAFTIGGLFEGFLRPQTVASPTRTDPISAHPFSVVGSVVRRAA